MFKYIKSSFKGGSTKPLSLKGHLGSTDATPEVPHPCPTPLPERPTASRRVVPRGFHVIFADSRRRKPTRLRLEMIRPESGRLGPESAISAETANSGQNSKKKKGAERTV